MKSRAKLDGKCKEDCRTCRAREDCEAAGGYPEIFDNQEKGRWLRERSST